MMSTTQEYVPISTVVGENFPVRGRAGFYVASELPGKLGDKILIGYDYLSELARLTGLSVVLKGSFEGGSDRYGVSVNSIQNGQATSTVAGAVERVDSASISGSDFSPNYTNAHPLIHNYFGIRTRAVIININYQRLYQASRDRHDNDPYNSDFWAGEINQVVRKAVLREGLINLTGFLCKENQMQVLSPMATAAFNAFCAACVDAATGRDSYLPTFLISYGMWSTVCQMLAKHDTGVRSPQREFRSDLIYGPQILRASILRIADMLSHLKPYIKGT